MNTPKAIVELFSETVEEVPGSKIFFAGSLDGAAVFYVQYPIGLKIGPSPVAKYENGIAIPVYGEKGKIILRTLLSIEGKPKEIVEYYTRYIKTHPDAILEYLGTFDGSEAFWIHYDLDLITGFTPVLLYKNNEVTVIKGEETLAYTCARAARARR